MGDAILALALATALDVQTSCLALKHVERAYESNRFLPRNCVGIAAAKGGITTGVSLTLWQVGKTHRKTAIWSAVAATAVSGVAVYYNIRTIRNSGRTPSR